MKVLKILPTVAVCFVALAGSAEARCTVEPVSGGDHALRIDGKLDASRLDRAILAAANYHRCRHGLSALQPLSALRDPAKTHSNWMARRNRLSHKSNVRGMQTLKDRINSTGLAARAGSENLAQLPLFNLSPRFRVIDSESCRFAAPNGSRLTPHSYQSFAARVVEMWMDSPGHRRNLLSRKTTHMAAAATVRPDAKTCGTIYVTQLFVG